MKTQNKKYTITVNGRQTSPDGEPDTFELITEGRYSNRAGVARISYEDSDFTGVAGAETLFVVEPDKITLRRGSWFGANMVFDEREKQPFLYATPYGDLPLSVKTELIERELTSKGGRVRIDYALDVDDVLLSRNSFDISIEQENQKQ